MNVKEHYFMENKFYENLLDNLKMASIYLISFYYAMNHRMIWVQ